MEKVSRVLVRALAAAILTTDCGFAGGSLPNDLSLPVETPRQQHSVLIGTPDGVTEAVCIKSGGTVGATPDGAKVCAKKINTFVTGDPAKTAHPTK